MLGDTPALIGGSGRRAPDRRRVSMRWMSGSVLTGMTSMLLMGGALYAALEGRQQLATPANMLDRFVAEGNGTGGKGAELGDRPIAIVALQPVSERVLQVPTVSRVGDSNVIRKRPFAFASAPLAIVPNNPVKYPPFNPLDVFRASNADQAIASSDVIYGADVESEVRLQSALLDPATASFDETAEISSAEAEAIVRAALPSLADDGVQIAALPYIDNSRFTLKQEDVAPTSSLNIRITRQNVSEAVPVTNDSEIDRSFSEEVITVPEGSSLNAVLAGQGFQPAALESMEVALTSEVGAGPLPSGTKLRIAWEQLASPEPGAKPIRITRRISVYRGGSHLRSVALTDDNEVVWGREPAPIPAIEATSDDENQEPRTRIARSNLPTIYDGIYRAALSQGLNKAQSRRIVRTVAFDVDFRAASRPDDDLEVFYSLEEGETEASANSEILYIGLTLAGVRRDYYRFRADDDGSVDYYDDNGKSAKKFLLRKPVPNGKFRSAFGPRRHPISRVVKMHQGVDFSAPRGTPIIAAGNGVVEKSGWAGGYGRQTIIRHANGYKTSYNHQHRIAKNIRPGARVTQGQIIGQVGTTGYSTGPHLHYEVIVNGRKVNPMKIRLPQGRSLSGKTLADFRRERDRIDALLEKGRSTEQTVAALN